MKTTGTVEYQVNRPPIGGEYVWAKGKRITVDDSTVVRIDTDEVISGWSEACHHTHHTGQQWYGVRLSTLLQLNATEAVR